MAPSIGMNLRVTGYKHQGGRRYMEDDFGVAYEQTADEKDLEYAFFGIFDGHGGREAAAFAKEHLMDYILSQKGFWEEDDDSVLKAIREGFIQTHYAMWKELEKWPKTASGLPSTAGTTASIAFIRRGKIFIGHVGDSAIVLGVQDPDNPDVWLADPLTIDHKPESLEESERIIQSGGKVVCKSGVPRVVWNRPRMGHQGPVRRSTHIDEIPFLAVARSLGDLWSYNSEENVFVVSPEPDCRVYPVDITKHRCLILATDGAWNMMTPQNSVSVVCKAEKSNEQHMVNPIEGKTCWINPSKMLVDTAIERWINSKLRADNTTVVTVMLDPPGPPRAQVLKNRQRELAELNSGRDVAGPSGIQAGDRGSMALVTNTSAPSSASSAPVPPSVPGPSSSSGGSHGVGPTPSVPSVAPNFAATASTAAGSSATTASRVPVSHPGSCQQAAAPSCVPGPSSSVTPVDSSRQQLAAATASVPGPSSSSQQQLRPEPQKHCTIISRFFNSSRPDYSAGYDLIKQRQCHPYNPNAPPAPAPPSVGTPPSRSPAAVTTAVRSTPSSQIGAGTSSSPASRVGGTLRDDTVLRRSASPISSPSSAMLRRSASPMHQAATASSSSLSSSGRSRTHTEDNVQCNEVSSSEDSPGHTACRSGQSTPPPPPGQENILPTSSSSKVPAAVPRTTAASPATKKAKTPARKSLCRELSSLQLEESRTTRSTVTKVSPIILSNRTTTRAARGQISSSPKTSTKSPAIAKKKMLQKPVLSKERTQSLVQMRCLQITEKLEMAKSVSTRSLSVMKRVDVVTKTVSSPTSRSAAKLNSPRKLRSKEESSNKEKVATPTQKTKALAVAPVKIPTTEDAPVGTPASRKKAVAKAFSPSKVKSPLRLRTPRSIDQHLKTRTPSRTLKLSRAISQIKLTPEPSPKQAEKPKAKVVEPSPKPKVSKSTLKTKEDKDICSPIIKSKATPKSKKPAPKSTPKGKLSAKTPKASEANVTPKSGLKRKLSTSTANGSPAKAARLVKIETPVKASTPAQKVQLSLPAKNGKSTPPASAKATRSAKATAARTPKATPAKAPKASPVKTAKATPAKSVKSTPKQAKATPSKPTSKSTKTPSKSGLGATPGKSSKKVDPKKGSPVGRKAPKTTPGRTPKAVANKKPLITRSKQATVLKLKK